MEGIETDGRWHLDHLEGLHDLAELGVVELDTGPVGQLLPVLQAEGQLDRRVVLGVYTVEGSDILLRPLWQVEADTVISLGGP